MQRLNLKGLLSKLQERTPSVVAAVHDFEVITPTLARVIVTLNSTDTDRQTMYNAIAAAFDNNLAPVEGSFRRIASMGAPALHGFVSRNRETRPYESASAKGMQALASNLLMDTADNSLWEVRTGANGVKMMSRSGDEDLSELLSTYRTALHGTPVLASVAQELAPREYAAFVDPATDTVRYGYVLSAEDEGKVTVLPNISDAPESDNGEGNTVADRVGKIEPITIDSCLIVESAYMEEADADKFQKFELPADSRSNAAMKTYYKQLYSYDPSYYGEIEKQIDEHASV